MVSKSTTRTAPWVRKVKSTKLLRMRFSSSPFYRRKIPKTTGRETFGDQMGEEISERVLEQGASPKDCIPTIVRFAAQSLLFQYRSFFLWAFFIVFHGRGWEFQPQHCQYSEREYARHTKHHRRRDRHSRKGEGSSRLTFKAYEGFVSRTLMVPKIAESDWSGVNRQIQHGENHFRLRRHTTHFWGRWPEYQVHATIKSSVIL